MGAFDLFLHFGVSWKLIRKYVRWRPGAGLSITHNFCELVGAAHGAGR